MWLFGIAVHSGHSTVYSGQDGGFMTRVKRVGAVVVQVSLPESYAACAWQIVAAPSQCDTVTVCKIMLERMP
jgi:hypothetical protein